MNHLESALGKKNNWWRYLIMFLATFGGANIIGAIPLIIVIFVKNGGQFSGGDISQYGIDKNLMFLLMLIPFLVSLWIFALLIKPLHGQTFRGVINGTNRIRWKKFFYAFVVWITMSGIYLIVDISLNGDNFIFNFSFANFFTLLIISVLLIPFQTSFEEVMFRGYLAQGVAVWTRNRIWVIVIPAVLFGMMHIMNPEIEKFGFWLTMPQYVIFGLTFGLVTVLDDGIEASMGAHAANNIFLSVFVTFKGSVLDTPALFVQKELDPLKDLISLVIFSTLFVVILFRKYKWDFKVLLRPVKGIEA